MTKKLVFGIGLSRTATMSLGNALNRLGYKTLHHPTYQNLFNLVNKFDAFVDMPVCNMYKFLSTIPFAKFILTERNIEDWLDSCRRHFVPNATLNIQGAYMRYQTFECFSFDEDKFRKKYIQHSKEVREFFEDKPERLLIMNIPEGDGYDKLCDFLGVPYLKEEFPIRNMTEYKIDEPIIISMGVIKQRIHLIPKIIKDIELQRTKPDKVYFIVSKEPFLVDKGIDEKELPILPNQRYEYLWVDNYGPLRRIVPVIKMYKDQPEAKIIVLDDDKKIERWTIQNLVYASEKHPDTAIGLRGWNIPDRENISIDDRQIYHWYDVNKLSNVDVISGGWAQLVKPRFFDDDFLNWEKYVDKFNVKHDDETFIAYQLAKNNIDRVILPGIKQLLLEYPVKEALCKDDRTLKAKALQINGFKKVLRKWRYK